MIKLVEVIMFFMLKIKKPEANVKIFKKHNTLHLVKKIFWGEIFDISYLHSKIWGNTSSLSFPGFMPLVATMA